MMMSPIGEVKGNNAFTLIEILLVVIIVGIIVALTAPNFSKGYSRLQLNSTADDLLSVSRWAQAMAIGQERIYALSFAHDHHSYQLVRAKTSDENKDQDTLEPVTGALGRMRIVPDAIHLETREDRIEFYPDGTIDPAIIQISSPEKKIVLSSAEVRGMMMKADSE